MVFEWLLAPTPLSGKFKNNALNMSYCIVSNGILIIIVYNHLQPIEILEYLQVVDVRSHSR